jgi:hypothetical protein
MCVVRLVTALIIKLSGSLRVRRFPVHFSMVPGYKHIALLQWFISLAFQRGESASCTRGLVEDDPTHFLLWRPFLPSYAPRGGVRNCFRAPQTTQHVTGVVHCSCY